MVCRSWRNQTLRGPKGEIVSRLAPAMIEGVGAALVVDKDYHSNNCRKRIDHWESKRLLHPTEPRIRTFDGGGAGVTREQRHQERRQRIERIGFRGDLD